MSESPQMFNVQITFDTSDGAKAVDRLVDALDDGAPKLARIVGVTSGPDSATIEFEPVPDDPRAGPTSTEGAIPGAEIVAALEGFSHRHSATVAAVRALLTASVARESAELPGPRQMRIDVVPAPPLPQDVLSSHRSDAVAPPRRTFRLADR